MKYFEWPMQGGALCPVDADSEALTSQNPQIFHYDKLGWMYLIFSFLVGHVALNWLSLSTKLHSPLYDEESFQF